MSKMMVKGNLYRIAPSMKKQGVNPEQETFLKTKGMLVTRAYAEQLNANYKFPDGGIDWFVIDEEATEEYYKAFEQQQKQKQIEKEAKELKGSSVADKLLSKMVETIQDSEESEGKPKRERRTKAEIEADNSQE